MMKQKLDEFGFSDLKNKVGNALGFRSKEEKQQEQQYKMYSQRLQNLWQDYIKNNMSTTGSIKPTFNNVADFLSKNGFSRDTINIAAYLLGKPRPRYKSSKTTL